MKFFNASFSESNSSSLFFSFLNAELIPLNGRLGSLSFLSVLS
jgi:hypothetical protein